MRLQEDHSVYQKFLKIRRELLKKSILKQSGHTNNNEMVYKKMGDYKKSIEFYERFLRIRKELL